MKTFTVLLFTMLTLALGVGLTTYISVHFHLNIAFNIMAGFLIGWATARYAKPFYIRLFAKY